MSKMQKIDVEIKQLEKEIVRLKKLKNSLEKPKPKPLEEVDFNGLYKLALEYIDNFEKHKYYDDGDYKNCLFEELLSIVYDKDIWNWINKNS